MKPAHLYRLAAVALLALSGCGDDDPTGPSADGAKTFDVTLTATQLIVQQDCDDFSGSASAMAGDFFIRVEMRRHVEGSFDVIGSTDYELIQANDGETVTVGFSADGVYQTAVDARLELDVSIYENDSGNVRQFDRTDTAILIYDREDDCWKYDGDGTCLGGTAGIVSEVLRVRGVSGDPCAVDLRWGFDAEER